MSTSEGWEWCGADLRSLLQLYSNRSKPLCVKRQCLGVRGRVGRCRCRRQLRAGFVVVGPGTDFPKCRFSGFSRPRWIPESPLIVVPGPLSTCGVGVDLELSPDGVGDPSLQRAESLFAGFAFGLFAQVVGAAGCVVGDLGDCDDVDRVVQRTVAAHVQPVPVGVRARGFDRCGAVVVGELGAGAEAADVAYLAEHDRCDHRADTVQLGEGRARRSDGVSDALLDGVDLSVDALDIGEVFGGDASTLDVNEIMGSMLSRNWRA